MSLISLLKQSNFRISAFTRQPVSTQDPTVRWMQLPNFPTSNCTENITNWFCAAPIWILADYLTTLQAFGVRRVVALSSTSRFTKNSSSSIKEQDIACRLADAESKIKAWAYNNGVEWVILRPTLIYGNSHDKNIVEIAHLIQKFGFFPILGKAKGLRQPVHVYDVAWACIAAMNSAKATNKSYNLSGGEVLSYREMVTRVFVHLHRPVRLLPIPLIAFKLSVATIRLLPRYQHWSTAMAERMNTDMVFDHEDALHDFGFKPRPFFLESDDLPVQSI